METGDLLLELEILTGADLDPNAVVVSNDTRTFAQAQPIGI